MSLPAATVSGGTGPLTLLWGRLRLFYQHTWAAHLGTPLVLPAPPPLPSGTGKFSGPQAHSGSCYCDPYLHSLLPLTTVSSACVHLSMCAALGTAAAGFLLPAAHTPAFAILPLAALSSGRGKEGRWGGEEGKV